MHVDLCRGSARLCVGAPDAFRQGADRTAAHQVDHACSGFSWRTPHRLCLQSLAGCRFSWPASMLADAIKYQLDGVSKQPLAMQLVHKPTPSALAMCTGPYHTASSQHTA